MIEKADEDGAVWLICDDCGETKDFSSFAKAVKFKRAQKEAPDGWRVSRSDDGEFHDHCPACTLKWKVARGLLP
jgi:Fe2+ or Zn2+ uptake regulation protein